jgi:hypothetical protein
MRLAERLLELSPGLAKNDPGAGLSSGGSDLARDGLRQTDQIGRRRPADSTAVFREDLILCLRGLGGWSGVEPQRPPARASTTPEPDAIAS